MSLLGINPTLAQTLTMLCLVEEHGTWIEGELDECWVVESTADGSIELDSLVLGRAWLIDPDGNASELSQEGMT